MNGYHDTLAETLRIVDEWAAKFYARPEKRGCYRCSYCGNEVSTDPDPRAAACCGEVGHNEWSDDDDDSACTA